MRIIAIANQKGGVGKTTTSVNLAGALAAAGRNVMVIDLDPQAHLTTFLGVDPSTVERSSYDVLAKAIPLDAALQQVRERLVLLPANLNLAAAEQELVAVVGRETILRDAIAEYRAPCDYIIIDCPPSLGLLTLNGLAGAREVFITMQPHFLSLQGLSQLLESVLLVQRRINTLLQVTGLLFCMYDARTSLSAEIVRDIEVFFARNKNDNSPWRGVRIFKTRIRRNVKLAESPSYGRTIFEYEPNCHGAEDYLAMAAEVEHMATAAIEPPRTDPATPLPTSDNSRSVPFQPVSAGPESTSAGTEPLD